MTIVIRHFGCAEYLVHKGYQQGPELVFRSAVPKISDIQRAVARRYGIPIAEMTSSRRTVDIARPRQVAMYLARQMTPQSMPQIGRSFRKDHTTVLHALRQIEKLMATSPELRSDIETLGRQIQP